MHYLNDLLFVSDYHYVNYEQTILIVASSSFNGSNAGVFNDALNSTSDAYNTWGSGSDLIINHIPPPSSMWCAKNIHTRLGRVYLEPKIITQLPDI